MCRESYNLQQICNRLIVLYHSMMEHLCCRFADCFRKNA